MEFQSRPNRINNLQAKAGLIIGSMLIIPGRVFHQRNMVIESVWLALSAPVQAQSKVAVP